MSATNKTEKPVSQFRTAPVATDPVALGDVFIFEGDAQNSVFWVVTKTHPDDEKLFYTLPGNNFPFAGSRDVYIQASDSPMGECRVYIGYGIWISAEQFDTTRRVGRIPITYIEKMQEKLEAAFSTFTLKAIMAEEEVDSDSDYEEDNDFLQKATAELWRYLNPV